MRPGVIGAFMIALVLGAADASRPAPITHSPFAGPQIYSIGVDRKGRRNLTQGRGQDDRLARSPDGRRLAFVRWQPADEVGNGTASLWTMRADGGDAQRLLVDETPHCQYCLGQAAWSPDGRRLALVRAGSQAGLWIVEARTGAARLIAPQATPSGAVAGEAPSWSPDGRWLAFNYADSSACRPGERNCATWSVRVVRAVGGRPRLLATKASEPHWSPNGRWIAYRITDGGESLGLGVVRPNGRSNRRVYPPRLRISAIGAFRWSPFGQLLFKAPSGAVLGALPDRRGVVTTQLVGFPTEGFFEWSPSRRRIAAIWSPSSRTAPQVWLQNADGTQRRRVTGEQHETEIPGGPFLRDVAWSRDGRRLFYVY